MNQKSTKGEECRNLEKKAATKDFFEELVIDEVWRRRINIKIMEMYGKLKVAPNS